MIKLFSKNWKTYKDNINKIYFIGWFEYKNVIYKELNSELLLLFKCDNIKDLIKKFNGNFSFIVSNQNCTLIIADRNRTYPVLYFTKNNTIIITDQISRYSKETNTNFQPDDGLADQYFSSTFIFDRYTLFKDVYAIKAGEIVYLDKKTQTFTSEDYFRWLPNMNLSLDENNLKTEADLQDRIFSAAIDRMIKSCPEVNNWVVPLSGGYDSRIIVNYLYKLGVKNVICFSYGIQNNKQSQISQQVAEALGYEWYFINYEEWADTLQKTGLIDNYINFAFNGTSTAHLQDFPAIYALKELKIITKNDVFVPGHTLDFITGGHLKPLMLEIETLKDVMPFMNRHFSNLGYYAHNKELQEHIYTIIKDSSIENNQIPEYFNWRERQSKFIVNSVRCYEFFGFEWRIPLWDYELIEYWSKVEFDRRLDRKLFKNVFQEFLMIDELKGIPFFNELIMGSKSSFKDKLKQIIPISIKTKLRSFGLKTSSYYKINEGLSLVYSNKTKTINEVVEDKNFPSKLKAFLLRFYKNQQIRFFNINIVSAILIISDYYTIRKN